MPYPTRIVLTGFMGSGKSTVGRLLAQRLGYAFVDLDMLIEERTAKRIPAIFAEDGEAAFRQHEHEALAATLQTPQAVVALGGGAVETTANVALLAAATDTAVVLLAAPFATLYERCRLQALDPAATARPNLTTREHAEARFLKREPVYAAVATHRVESESLSAQETVHLLLQALSA